MTYKFKDFKTFWKNVEKDNPQRKGKMGILTWDELKFFSKQIFEKARAIK